MEKISQYCQKCRSANEPGEDNCIKCGSPLMLVVYPRSMRHDEILIPSFYEDHLLERVSLLELRLSQITERMSITLDLMLKQSKTIQSDHLLLQTIAENLNLLNTENGNSSKESFDRQKKINEEDKKRQIIEKIIAEENSSNHQLFIHLLHEGTKLLERDEEKQAFQMLEQAVQISPENVSLLLYVAEKQFLSDKFGSAKENLEKALKISPERREITLLLGAINADEKNVETAKKYLSLSAANPHSEIVSDIIWGMIGALQENWLESLAAFNSVLKKQSLMEVEYLTGCVYFQLDNFEKSRKHFLKVVKKDQNFSDAWFMLSFVEKEQNSAADCLEKAKAIFESGAQCSKYLHGNKLSEIKNALPFQNLSEQKRLLSGGSLRLSKFFKKMILDSVHKGFENFS